VVRKEEGPFGGLTSIERKYLFCVAFLSVWDRYFKVFNKREFSK
jgi:hypothetical protein